VIKSSPLHFPEQWGKNSVDCVTMLNFSFWRTSNQGCILRVKRSFYKISSHSRPRSTLLLLLTYSSPLSTVSLLIARSSGPSESSLHDLLHGCTSSVKGPCISLRDLFSQGAPPSSDRFIPIRNQIRGASSLRESIPEFLGETASYYTWWNFITRTWSHITPLGENCNPLLWSLSDVQQLLRITSHMEFFSLRGAQLF
jgi:hypothetical protein